MDRLQQLVCQLDGLVVLLAASHEEVFATIKSHEEIWFPSSQDPSLPDTFDAYRYTLSNAAFLLGYAYFEAFLADIARAIYLARPELLPKDRNLTYKEVLNFDSKDAIVSHMASQVVRSALYRSVEDIQEFFREKLHINWPDNPEIVVASRMRNCLMHNGGRVDERLAEVCSRDVGTEIRLMPDDVHGYGVEAREAAWSIWHEACEHHLK
ncbi:MAG: hypothetical protein KJ060_10200 [Candidatus Hydrogenedentes bacterium]|nr:hypothetical protein [Candidatus Hydrogenedentota bacterium]